MTRQRYSINEAWNRILRAFQGKAAPSEQPDTLEGEILSINQAVSDLAELAVGALPNETGELPEGISVPVANLPSATTEAEGIIEIATVAESLSGTSSGVAVTPEGMAAYHEAEIPNHLDYGAIYNNSTGTAVVALSTSWQKLTGSFQGDASSCPHTVPDYLNDKITINGIGVFFAGFQLSFSGGNNSVVEAALYLDGVRQEQIRFRRKLGAGGDVGSASAQGTIQTTGSNTDLEIYVRADAGTPNFKVESGQLYLYGVI